MSKNGQTHFKNLAAFARLIAMHLRLSLISSATIRLVRDQSQRCYVSKTGYDTGTVKPRDTFNTKRTHS